MHVSRFDHSCHDLAGVCSWAICAANGAVAVFNLRPSSGSCESALQPSAVYLPPPGTGAHSARLLLHRASKLSVLCCHGLADSGVQQSSTPHISTGAGAPTQLSLTVLDNPADATADKRQQLQPVSSCSLQRTPASEDQVTRQLLAGGDVITPSLLVQASTAVLSRLSGHFHIHSPP